MYCFGPYFSDRVQDISIDITEELEDASGQPKQREDLQSERREVASGMVVGS